MIDKTLGALASAQTLQDRYRLAWQYLNEKQPSKSSHTPSGYPTSFMCWQMLYAHAGQGSRLSRINKSQCWEMVCAYVNSRAAK